ncbi:hypothetical protein U1Q18_002544, partial [Sarracenia purpurea var. burkii]
GSDTKIPTLGLFTCSVGDSDELQTKVIELLLHELRVDLIGIVLNNEIFDESAEVIVDGVSGKGGGFDCGRVTLEPLTNGVHESSAARNHRRSPSAFPLFLR